MSKKIIVVSKEFDSQYTGIDVDSRFYDEGMKPIMSRWGDGELCHLGQISSSFGWAQHDCTYERYKDHFDKLFPEVNGDFEFEYQLIKLNNETNKG